MRVDVSQLLSRLAERAGEHQERLQEYLRQGHSQIGRALQRQEHIHEEADTESVEWALRAQVAMARLNETQWLIEAVTHQCAADAKAGRTDAEVGDGSGACPRCLEIQRTRSDFICFGCAEKGA